ncbi:Aste57867_20756 [Aphanomyces stellatus]|uniref:Aste57867_20756 protein n=1 Tax=Aphanomyces stellatus TaxID=120398 RepID=A0A485LKF7_9STRA|nr:hypothetical protein As57867_020688 [Aphanomyces stellatus]VFT97435.1 Aste57867_20756 [Aphanomyces stellatus]
MRLLRPFAVVVSFLGHLTLTNASASTHCSAVVQDTDYYGNDIKATQPSSIDGCCTDCQATPGCHLFVWRYGNCYLKYMQGAASVALGAQASMLPTAVPSTCGPIEPNTDYYGNDIRAASRASVDDCCAECQATSGCKLFVWRYGNCYLKYAKGASSVANGALAVSAMAFPRTTSPTTTTPTTTTSLHTTTTTPPTRTPAPITTTASPTSRPTTTATTTTTTAVPMTTTPSPTTPSVCSRLVQNVNYDGFDLSQVPNVATAGACCTLCQATPKCFLFVWLDGVCRLKSARGMSSLQAGAVSATVLHPLCPPRVRQSWDAMTTDDQTLFVQAIALAMDKGFFADFVYIHADHMSNYEAHNTCVFLFWHRKFLLGFETMLRSLGPEFACLTLPYMDYVQQYAAFQRGKCTSIATCAAATQALGGNAPGSSSSTLSFFGYTYPQTTCITAPPLNHLCDPAAPSCARCLPRADWSTISLPADLNFETIRQNVFAGNNSILAASRAIELSPHNVMHSTLNGPMNNLFVSPMDPIFYLHHTTIDLLHTIYYHCNVEPLQLPTAAARQTDTRSFQGCVTNNNEPVGPKSTVLMRHQLSNGNVLDVTDPASPLAPFFADLPTEYWALTDTRDLGTFSYSYGIRNLLGDLYTNCATSGTTHQAEAVIDEATTHAIDHVVTTVKPSSSAAILFDFRHAVYAAAAAVGLTEVEADVEIQKMQVMLHQECLPGDVVDFTPEFKAMWHTDSPSSFKTLRALEAGELTMRIPTWRALNKQFFACPPDDEVP